MMTMMMMMMMCFPICYLLISDAVGQSLSNLVNAQKYGQLI